jgi:hypothetical protein
MRRQWVPVAIAAALSSVVLAGCGSALAPRPDSSHPPNTSSTVAEVLGDLAAARSAVLSASDLGPGWVAARHSSFTIEQKLADCVGSDAAYLAGDPKTSVRSDDYSRNTGNTQIESGIAFSRSPEEAQLTFANLSGERMAVCFNQVYTAALQTHAPPGTSLKSVHTDQYVGFTPFLDRLLARRITISLTTTSGQPLTAFVDFIFTEKGRVAAVFSFMDVGAPFDPVLEHQLLQKVTDRIAHLAQ